MMDAAEPLDGPKIRTQIAALATHLSAAGVQFLPRAAEASVQAWSQRFASASAASVEPIVADPPRIDEPPPTEPPPTEPPPTESSPTESTLQPAVKPAVAATPPTMFSAAAKSYDGDPIPIPQRSARLAEQAAIVAACTRCPVLAECRQHTVYGEGSMAPRFVFFGEAPGADEDQTGRPFVGKAGQLLDKMIIACKLRREDVYLVNTVKCRPPGNRNPEPDELANCREYFESQLQTLRPEYIVCLGAIAAQTLLETKDTVGKMRGKLHRYRDSKVLVTYHPAYLLRNPKAKAAVWQDLQMMLADAAA